MQWYGYSVEIGEETKKRAMITFDDIVNDAEKIKILEYIIRQIKGE